MKTILLILGAKSGEFAGGKYNRGLFDAAQSHLKSGYKILTSIVEDGYAIEDEIAKWKQADYIIYQYPIYWFMMPAILKQYLDDVYAYGEFFSFNDGGYGSGGLMKGKKVMLSTTWNAPEDAFKTDKSDGKFFDGATIDEVLLPMRKSQTYCGMEELTHFACNNIIKSPNFENDKKRFLKHLDSIFN